MFTLAEATWFETAYVNNVVHLPLQQQTMHLHVCPCGICSVVSGLADEHAAHRQHTMHSIFHALL